MEENSKERAKVLRSLGIFSTLEISEMVGVHERTVQKWEAKPQTSPITLTDDKAFEIEGNYCIAGDFHVDAVDWKYVIEMIDTCKGQGIDQLMIAGDLFGFSKISRHPKVFVEMSVKDELEEARKLLGLLFTHFKKVYFFMGNHDERFLQVLEGDFTIEDLAHTICPSNVEGQFLVSDSNFAWITSGGKKWLIMHPYEYNKNPLVVARRFAHYFGCNVIHHHQHLSAEGLSDDGRYLVIDNGCMCEQKRTQYASKRISTMPSFAKGYVILINGAAHRYYQVNE